MNHASDLSMLFLLGLHLGDGVAVRDGQLFLAVNGTLEQPVPAESLDELEERGWIDTATEPPAVTDRGKYWLGRWMKAKCGKGRIVKQGTHKRGAA